MTDIFLTAEEAYPAFERLVASAQSEVLISMRMFDVATPLYSDAVDGDSWADLIAHQVANGVSFDVTISDFDPIARPDLHRYSWECLDRLQRAAQNHPDRLTARVAMHPARTSGAYRFLFSPLSKQKLQAECDRLNDLSPQDCDGQLGHMPLLCQYLDEERPLRLKRWLSPELCPATHHQKMAVVDGKALYIGGLDLNPRRYDTLDHDRSPEQTWHDIQVLTYGDVAQSARTHILSFLDVENNTCPAPETPGLLRTISRRAAGRGPRIGPVSYIRELEDAHLDLINGAKDFIYIETQFLRSTVIADALVAAAKRGVQAALVMPAAPEDIAFDKSTGMDARLGEHMQAQCVDKLRSAFGDNVFLGAPAQPVIQDGERESLDHAPIIYVHAKLIVADCERAIVSSANLNGRSMRWDTEAGIELTGADARHIFERCRDHWFCGNPPASMTKAAHWARAGAENKACKPQDRQHFILPYKVAPAKRMAFPFMFLPEEIV